MDTVEVIYERGIVVRNIEAEWYLVNLSGGKTARITQPSEVAKAYNVRPIVIKERLNSGEERELLLKNNPVEIFGLQISGIEQTAIRSNLHYYKVLNIIYLLSSAQHHCLQLCKAYASICEEYSKFPIDLCSSTVSLFSGQAEPYFEFDALVTTVRRAYDACRYLLWHYFTHSKGSLPSSFYKTLPLCSLPSELSERLNLSWLNYGKLITEYRDCIQHYSPIDFGLASVRIEKLAKDVLSVSALLPDNPLEHTRGKFIFSEKRDSLTYGWEITNEILAVVSLIVEAACTQGSKQDGAKPTCMP